MFGRSNGSKKSLISASVLPTEKESMETNLVKWNETKPSYAFWNGL